MPLQRGKALRSNPQAFLAKIKKLNRERDRLGNNSELWASVSALPLFLIETDARAPASLSSVLSDLYDVTSEIVSANNIFDEHPVCSLLHSSDSLLIRNLAVLYRSPPEPYCIC